MPLRGLNNAVSYTVHVCKELRCIFEYYVQKNTPCKHILYIMMNFFNVKESSYILKHIHLTCLTVAYQGKANLIR